MKRNLPYHILLAVTILVAGLAVLDRLEQQKSFPVQVRYDFPSASRKIEEASLTEVQAREDQPSELEQGAAPWEEASGSNEAEETSLVVYFPLNLNEAVYEELVLIPRVGDVTAQRILQYREVLGEYGNLEQLMEIKGIGEKTFESIAPYLYVEGE